MYDYTKDIYYNVNIEYLIDDEIIEYDMSDAGFSLIKQFRLLPMEKINELEKIPKGRDRHIQVGIIQRDDKVFSERLKECFARMREAFITSNKLLDNDIIAVKKDAIFTSKICNKLKFDNIQFNAKSTYSSYIRFPELNNLEIYYNNNEVDIKGMGEIAFRKHRIYMIEFIIKIIKLLESRDNKVKREIIAFVDEYGAGKLAQEYYLEFNSKSSTINPIYNYLHIIIPLISIIDKEMR